MLTRFLGACGVATVLTVACAGSTLADQTPFEGPYANLSLGYNSTDWKVEAPSGPETFFANGVAVGGGLGYQTHVTEDFILGVEAGGAYSTTKTDVGDVSLARDASFSLTVRPGYAIQPKTQIYGIAGVSGARFQAENGVNANEKAWRFGPTVGVGVESYITDDVSLRLEGTHAFYGSVTDTSGARVSRDENIVALGVSYHF